MPRVGLDAKFAASVFARLVSFFALSPIVPVLGTRCLSVLTVAASCCLSWIWPHSSSSFQAQGLWYQPPHVCLAENLARLEIELLLLCLGLGRGTSLAVALLFLDNGDSSRDKLNATVAAVGASMELAVVVQVVLTVELVLATEFTVEAVWSFTVETSSC